MSADNTSSPRRNGERRAVEDSEFDAFAGRVARAYAGRVASGDVRALVAFRQVGPQWMPPRPTPGKVKSMTRVDENRRDS